ncbi:L,D-transpeptidase family protein [Thalassotalea mangrovi]|uniref:L,D-TPase catalytic domain-containing protein n=1 Tax=Thalassotalea mangrovi TaxID=2572245 RepID=A0A4U1B8I0_9GAMM|nr:L,D-transpeptidase family protein [Thalassotalea mangrovi]TKB46823.1 hypothetical protein E8M12_03160 [Thalassotalea mangrovi]
MPRFLNLMLLFPSFAFADIDLVRVDKSENAMFLIRNGEIVRRYHVALGENPKGHKMQQGDERTPEGRYTLDYVKEDSAYYRAMHISYPNDDDLSSARERGVSAGGFIMIHGQRNGMEKLAPITQQYNWTDGCIALTNEEMDEFMALVDIGTPIEIEW